MVLKVPVAVIIVVAVVAIVTIVAVMAVVQMCGLALKLYCADYIMYIMQIILYRWHYADCILRIVQIVLCG